MPLEFALRPRIRLRDDFAAAPRRSRWRLPRFALPVLGYWLAIGGISYALIYAHDSTDSAPVAGDLSAASEPQADVVAPALPSKPEPTPLATADSEPGPASLAPPPPALAPPPVVDEQEPFSVVDPPHPSRVTAASAERARRSELARVSRNQADDELALVPAAAPTLAPASAPELESPPPSRDTGHVSSSLPSCEAAAAAATQDLDFSSSDRTADLPSSAIASVLENGVWLSSCGVPASTSLDVCVAIKGGRVTAATVVSSPANPGINACVKQRAAALQFPYSSRVDIARTRF